MRALRPVPLRLHIPVRQPACDPLPRKRPLPNPPDSPSQSPPRAKVVTDARSDDRRLRGGTYAVQFGEVWRAALIVARTLRGWEVLRTDARDGVIEAQVQSWIWKRPDRIEVRITLDEVGLTRVDLASAPLAFRLGSGLSRRRVGRFMRALEAALQSAS